MVEKRKFVLSENIGRLKKLSRGKRSSLLCQWDSDEEENV
jgi:hypothetical protein